MLISQGFLRDEILIRLEKDFFLSSFSFTPAATRLLEWEYEGEERDKYVEYLEVLPTMVTS